MVTAFVYLELPSGGLGYRSIQFKEPGCSVEDAYLTLLNVGTTASPIAHLAVACSTPGTSIGCDTPASRNHPWVFLDDAGIHVVERPTSSFINGLATASRSPSDLPGRHTQAVASAEPLQSFVGPKLVSGEWSTFVKGKHVLQKHAIKMVSPVKRLVAGATLEEALQNALKEPDVVTSVPWVFELDGEFHVVKEPASKATMVATSGVATSVLMTDACTPDRAYAYVREKYPNLLPTPERHWTIDGEIYSGNEIANPVTEIILGGGERRITPRKAAQPLSREEAERMLISQGTTCDVWTLAKGFGCSTLPELDYNAESPRPWVIHTAYGEPYTVPEPVKEPVKEPAVSRGCMQSGTLVILADGRRVPIEDLQLPVKEPVKDKKGIVMAKERVRIEQAYVEAAEPFALAPAGLSPYQAALALILNNGDAKDLAGWTCCGAALPTPWDSTWNVAGSVVSMAHDISYLPGAPTREDADLRGYLWVVEVPTETAVSRLFVVNADTQAEALIRAGVERAERGTSLQVVEPDCCFQGDDESRDSINPSVNKPLRTWAVSSNAWHASEAWLRELAYRQTPWCSFNSPEGLEEGLTKNQVPTIHYAYTVANDPQIQGAVERGWLWLFEEADAIALINAPTIQAAWKEFEAGNWLEVQGDFGGDITVSRVHACALNATLTELTNAPKQAVGVFAREPSADFAEGIWQVPPPFTTKRKDTYGTTTTTTTTIHKEIPMANPPVPTKSVHLSALADNATQGLIIGTTQEAVELVQGLLAAQARKSSNPIIGGVMAEATESRAGNVAIGLGVGVGLPFMMHLIPEGRPRRLAQTVSTVCQQQAFSTGFRAIYQVVAKPLINHFVAAAASLPEEWEAPAAPASLPEVLRSSATEVVGEKAGSR